MCEVLTHTCQGDKLVNEKNRNDFIHLGWLYYTGNLQNVCLYIKDLDGQLRVQLNHHDCVLVTARWFESRLVSNWSDDDDNNNTDNMQIDDVASSCNPGMRPLVIRLDFSNGLEASIVGLFFTLFYLGAKLKGDLLAQTKGAAFHLHNLACFFQHAGLQRLTEQLMLTMLDEAEVSLEDVVNYCMYVGKERSKLCLRVPEDRQRLFTNVLTWAKCCGRKTTMSKLLGSVFDRMEELQQASMRDEFVSEVVVSRVLPTEKLIVHAWVTKCRGCNQCKTSSGAFAKPIVTFAGSTCGECWRVAFRGQNEHSIVSLTKLGGPAGRYYKCRLRMRCFDKNSGFESDSPNSVLVDKTVMGFDCERDIFKSRLKADRLLFKSECSICDERKPVDIFLFDIQLILMDRTETSDWGKWPARVHT